MKSTLRLISVRTTQLFMFSVILLTLSCKKDQLYVTPVNPSPGNNTTNVFTDPPLNLVSDFEKQNGIRFSPGLCYRLGSAMNGAGGTISDIGEIIKTLKEVHDFNKPETEYNTLKGGINQLQQQVAALSSQITQLGQQLSLDVSQLMTYMGALATNMYVGYLREALDSTASDGLTYFPKTAAAYKSQGLDSTSAKVQQLRAAAVNYALQVHPSNGSPVPKYDMKNIITQLNLLIVPQMGMNNNVVMNYANEIINACKGKGYTDAASVKILYLMLENYFLALVNYQFQATNIYTNACSLADSTGSDAKNWYTQTFATMIRQEIDVFLHSVNYLVVNVYDYRTQNQLMNDLKFANAGLSENDAIMPSMARAQFVANILYTALGVPCPVVAGSVITPNKYSDGSGSYINTLSMGAYAPGVSEKEYSVKADSVFGQYGVPSQIPNTYYVSGTSATCYPDNHWNVYNVGKLGVPDNAWSGLGFFDKVTVTLKDNGNQNPWPHSVPVTGQVRLMWYDPSDPSQVYYSKTSSCTMQFGYFCGYWGWGFPYVSHSDLGKLWRPDYFDVNNFNKDFQGPGISNTPVPFMATSDHGGNLYVHSRDGFTFQNNSLAAMFYNGNAVQTAYYYILGDLWCTFVSTGGTLPGINGTIQAWSAFNATYSMGGSNNDLWILLGTGLNKWNYGGRDLYYAQSNVIWNHAHNQPGQTYQAVGVSGNLQPNTRYQPSISYYYQTYNIGSPPANITVRPVFAFVYGGTYPVPTPY